MKRFNLTIMTIVVLSGLIFSSCTPVRDTPDLAGTSWRLISYGPAGNQIPAVAGIGTELSLGANGQVSGYLGCNGFSGQYELKDGKIVFSPLAATLMACPDPQMAQESAAFQVMSGAVRFEMQGNRLTIYDASGTEVITLERIVIE